MDFHDLIAALVFFLVISALMKVWEGTCDCEGSETQTEIAAKP